MKQKLEHIEANFTDMMHGVLIAETLTDTQKNYIIEMLQDQLRIEKECVLLMEVV